LADSSVIVAAADWSGGAPVRLDGDEVIVLTEIFDELALPRSKVRGLVFAQRSHPGSRQQLVERVRGGGKDDAASPQNGGVASRDELLLTNGDRLHGKLTALERGSLTLKIEADEATLPLSRVEAIKLATGQRTPAGAQPARLAVSLRNGSLLLARSITGNSKRLTIELGGGAKLNGGTIGELSALQSLEGQFDYLSDLEPTSYRHVPYLSIERPLQRDRSADGKPLIVGGSRYLKGIGMHSAARLTYRLDKSYQRFTADVAVDDSAGNRGSVTFGVYLLKDDNWTEAYKSGVVRGGDGIVPVSVDVAGAEGLTLTVDYADRGDELDHADWLDARLTKN
jgi:hypothetical protein